MGWIRVILEVKRGDDPLSDGLWGKKSLSFV